MTAMRAHCPSCRHRLSPYAVECPVCGLGLSGQGLPRPLLFQASALQHGVGSRPEARPHALAAPALGRVTPVTVSESPREEASAPFLPPAQVAPAPLALGAAPSEPSLWPLVRMETAEFLLLALLNALFAGLASLLCRASLGRTYEELWPYLVPVHLCLSWAFLMVPVALAGQTPMMGSLGLLLDTAAPEKRLTFSIFHLVSVVLFPLSFLCMVLTPGHRTLAEVLTGQEILSKPRSRQG